MAKVFVSYSRKDIEFAKSLTAELQKSELDFWIDWEGIPPTVDWWREIEKGIEESDVFIFLISPDSAKSKICGKEIDTAVKNAKRIIPLVTRDIKGDEAPQQLSHLNWIFFRESDDFDAAVKKLMTAIQTDYEWAATHRRLQVKALDWERNNKDNGFLLRGMDLLDAEQDLAINTSKDPHPTDLQRKYVLASRKATDQQRRFLTSISIAGVIALAALAVFGLYQANEATQSRDEAQAASTRAVANEKDAQNQAATAQAASTLAVSNEQQAKEQAKIALARQLASQAQTINATRNSKQMTAILLSAESMKLFHNGEAASFLINHNLPVHLNSMMNLDGNVNSVAFSPDGAYVVSGGNDATARVWNTATGKEVARVTMQGRVASVAFSPDGKYVVTGGCDTEDAGTYVCTKGGSVRVWEALNGKEISRVTHDIEVLSVAFSPDGTHIVSGGCDEADLDQICRKGLVKVSEAVTGKEIARMIHDATVRSVAFNPDGKYVASGSDDFTARIWEIATGKEVAHKTFDGGIQAIAFSDDGKYVVAVGGKTVLIWEATTDHEVARVTYDNMTNIFSAVNSVAFSPDGRYVVIGSDDYTARVLEAASGKEVTRVTHDGSVIDVAFSPDGKFIVSGSLDGTARMWEANTGKEVARMSYDGVVSSVSFSADGKHAVSAGCDKEDLDGTCYKSSVRVWERLSQDDYANPIDFSLNEKYIAAPSENNTVTVWDIATQKKVISVPYDGEISFIFLSPEGTYVILGSMDGVAHVWEIAAQKEIAHMDGVADSLALSRDGKYIITGSNHDYDARVWETTTGNEIARMTHNDIVRVVAFSPDGKYVASTACDVELEWPQAGCKESSVRVWEPLTGKEVARLIHENYAFSLAFSPDGRYVISGSWDNTARLLEISTNKEVARFTHGFVVSSVAFSPNGKYAVTASYDRTVRVWEVTTWKEIMRIMHDSRVNSAAISPDGKYVVSGSHDHTTRVWELLTGKEVARIVQEDDIDFVVFSPDGKYIATSGENGTRLWKWQADDIISDACQYVTRNLTFAEWNQYIGDAWPYPTKQEEATCPNLPIEPEVSVTPKP